MNEERDPRFRRDPLEQRAQIISIVGIVAFLIWNLPRTLAVISNIPGLAQIEGAVVHMGSLEWRGINPYPDPLNDKNISFLYGPLGPQILGLAWLIGGGSFVLPRAVSTIAMFATGAVLGRFVGHRRGWLAGVWATAASIAILSTFSGFFSLARIDSLSNLFIILSITFGIDYVEKRADLRPAAAAMACALLCRQTAVVPLLLLTFTVWWRRGFGNAARYALVPLFIFALTAIAYHLASGGWSSKYIFSPGQHAWAFTELAQTMRRLFISPEMWFFWILFIFGFRAVPTWWAIVWCPIFLLTIAHSSRWAALTISLAPSLLMAVPMAACAAVRERRRAAPVRWIVQLSFIAFPVALFFVKLPPWGCENLINARVARRAVEEVAAHPGRVLVNGYQDYALLAGAGELDDVHSALGPDTAGDPALDFINNNLKRKRYSILLLKIGELRGQADSILNIRPSTADGLRRCAASIEHNYHRVEGDFGAADAFVPN
ncbi:MAG: hypothetical protein HY286_11865 [Planctomycetes bacterium]|nr:hypothetical protein [Planctomycetota bacterium]